MRERIKASKDGTVNIKIVSPSGPVGLQPPATKPRALEANQCLRRRVGSPKRRQMPVRFKARASSLPATCQAYTVLDGNRTQAAACKDAAKVVLDASLVDGT